VTRSGTDTGRTGDAERLESLDVFRGVTIAAMILVSTPGTWTAVYPPLDHALWNGWTPTDLVFPFLLFAMGAAVPFALARRRDTRGHVHTHIIRRALMLFALGLALNAIETAPPINWTTFRIPGVLQRIAIVYATVACLTERTLRRTQIAVACAALLAYWAAMALVPVPGVGSGVLTPAGNLASFVDRLLLGRHILQPLWDPEGLLSTVPAVATALCGVFAGDWLKEQGAQHRALWMWVAGVVVTVVGLLWGRFLPINKNLWTGSFALLSAGLAAQALALCHWAIDVRGWRAWSSPFVAFGRNPLAGYFLSVGFDSVLTHWMLSNGLSLKAFVYRGLFASRMARCCLAESASFAYAFMYVTLWALVLAGMNRRRIYIGV
jgi:predicted acyltransferase